MPFTIVTGPCVIESETAAMEAAEFLTSLFESYPDVHFVFKSSYDKANRTSVTSYRGPGLEEGLAILERIKTTFNIPIFTDVHSPLEASEAGAICDYIQIPAFLSRQTDLLVAAGKAKATVNIKKGQFMAPWDMKHAVDKIRSTGEQEIFLTERGVSFGYNNLVVDMRSIPLMQQLGCPVLFDATHSVQLPGGEGSYSGGQRELIPTLAKAAIGAGCDGLYAESHPCPENALCDAACMLPFATLKEQLPLWLELHEVALRCPSCV